MAFRLITIWVVEARDLPPIDHGSLDPYVEISMGGKMHRETHHLMRTIHPVWNERVEFTVNIHQIPKNTTRPWNEVCFEIRDWNLLKDKHIGYTFLKIDPAWLNQEVHEFSLPLEQATGVLKVRVSVQRLFGKKQARELVHEASRWRSLNPGKDWIDPEFPHDVRSVGGDGHGVAGWKSMRELSQGKGMLFTEHKAKSGDVVQGALGTCYLLGAMAVVATRGELIRDLFFGNHSPEDAIFTVRFFIQGEWHYVVIDDYLPVGPEGQLRFARSRDPLCFWVPLMEKAYAKLFRSYHAIEGGNTAEALLDLTGEGAETFAMDDPRFQRMVQSGQLEKILKQWKKSRFLLGVSRYEEGAKSEADTGQGILAGHAYSVLGVANPTTEKGFLGLVGNKHTILVKVRNPWGDTEWKGAWSDGAPEWTDKIRKQLKHVDANDGVFWMSLDDFLTQFNRFSVVRMYSHKFSIFDRRWHSWHFCGEWDEFSDGGCMNHDTWGKNSQYGMEILDEKEPTSVFIYVSQPDRRLHGRNEYDQSIGVYVLKVEDAHVRLHEKGKILQQTFPPWSEAPTFTNKRDTCLRVDLTAGQYLIMPTTFNPGVHMPYSLGIFSERKAKVWEILTEQTSGIPAEWSEDSAGGPPEIGAIARAEKRGGTEAAFWRNPKFVITMKSSRRVQDDFTVSVRLESKGDFGVGLRLYKKTKSHKPKPLREKNVLETINPAAAHNIVHEFKLQKKQGPFVLVPFSEKEGLKAKFNISITSKEPGLILEMYH